MGSADHSRALPLLLLVHHARVATLAGTQEQMG